MPWKESHLMDERIRFISRLLDGERMIDLCREFGISRKTGHKFHKRYMAHGVRGLVDQSRAHSYHPHQTHKEIERLIVALRKSKPSWGPKKLKAKFETLQPGLKVPAASTIGAILGRYGIPSQKRRRRGKAYYSTALRESHAPNDIWCIDFKGQFRLGNGQYCYPLTVSDHFSRFLLGCESLENTKTAGAMASFEQIFGEYGLPKVIRSDNGAPFASAGLQGLSQLAVWFMRLGIELERIEPGHPEQNGRHERLHWTLKYEATRPPSYNQLQQQERFDEFRDEYNNDRPHEALQMKTPASIYAVSESKYPDFLEELEYPTHDITCRVNTSGMVYMEKGKRFYLSNSLSGENIGLREIKPKLWLVNFMDQDLGCFSEEQGVFTQKPPVNLEAQTQHV